MARGCRGKKPSTIRQRKILEEVMFSTKHLRTLAGGGGGRREKYGRKKGKERDGKTTA